MTARHYYPANGTEGDAFERRWCDHCTLDKAFRETWDAPTGPDDGCDILAMAFTDQPSGWIYRHGMPWCLAFVEDKTNPARCLFTKEMDFGAAA